MPTITTPGVHVEEIPSFPPSVAPVATAIPAFIGYTEKAEQEVPDDLLHVPMRIESLLEYQQHFGGAPQETALTVQVTETTDSAMGPLGINATVTLAETDRSPHILFHSMQLYFANGGGTCYIVSAGAYKEAEAALDDAELVTALDTLETVDEPTLLVVPEAQNLDSAVQCTAVGSAMLGQCAQLGDRFALLDVHGARLAATGAALKTAVDAFRADEPNTDLDRGAAYVPNLVTRLDLVVDGTVTEVAHILDGAAAVSHTLAEWETQDNRIYERAVAAIRAFPLRLPPSAAIAGLCCRIDGERGVWKAPANAPLLEVLRPTVEITDAQQGGFNVDPTGKSVNAIRSRLGRGTVVWGARTLAGNSNEWRYVNVRRFFLFAEESIKKATEQFVFEPNDANTWVKVQAMIENFLTLQWRAGALQGVKPEHAFYVAVGLGRTMTALDILEGRMIVEIGLAVVRPAEFIVLRFSHKMAES